MSDGRASRKLTSERGIRYGGDYNPEQWPREVWAEDVALMREAGVDLVTLGVFSWALLEPAEGRYEFAMLDEVIGLLAEADIEVDLATATASPPPWLSLGYPETLPVDIDGRRLWPGSRQAFCPSSPVFRQRALALVEALATRYGSHPSVVLWHVSNELGCANAHCYCDVSAEAFRHWLQKRYGDVDALNDSWGTAFWSQRVQSFDEVLPPRAAPSFRNPGQQLDFARFSSDELLAHYCAERDLLRKLSPDVPVTTNFMVTGHIKHQDYWRWAGELDVIANDHYLDGSLPDPHIELAFCADATRGMAGGEPWLLMEHSTSAVNWQPRNIAKQPGEMRRNSLQHVARGADAVLFFQWRASRAGAEKYHSGLLPHAGTETRLWREVVQLGQDLDRLAEVAGSVAPRARVALLHDYPSWWGTELDAHPTADVHYLDQPHAYYGELWRRGIAVDVVSVDHQLDGYDVVVVPTLYMVTDETQERVRRYVEGGGTVLVTYFSGIVDEHDHVRLGGYPGAFRDVLGVRTEEFYPLHAGETVQLDDGSTATVWTELLQLAGAEAVRHFVDGPLPGVAAVTRHTYGAGAGWYVPTRLDPAGVSAVVDEVLARAGVTPDVVAPQGVEVLRRVGSEAGYLFVINHTTESAEVAARGVELLTGISVEGTLTVSGGGVAVVRTDLPTGSA